MWIERDTLCPKPQRVPVDAADHLQGDEWERSQRPRETAPRDRAPLEHQRRIGNDLITPMPLHRFPGLEPGDRWCVTASNWLRAHEDGAAAFVVLASTHERALELVPLTALQEHAVDVPPDPAPFGG